MRPVRLVKRGLAVLSGLAVVFLIGAGTAVGATTLVLDPDTATPGISVTIYNACLGVTDAPPDALTVAFVSTSRAGLLPTDQAVPRAVARALTGPDRYVVVVPRLTPGLYDVRLECLPGDWRTNTAEGGTLPLKVLAAPDTSTRDLTGASAPHDPRPMGLLLLVCGIAGGVAACRRLTQRR
jgi:hypothetical protein